MKLRFIECVYLLVERGQQFTKYQHKKIKIVQTFHFHNLTTLELSKL